MELILITVEIRSSVLKMFFKIKSNVVFCFHFKFRTTASKN